MIKRIAKPFSASFSVSSSDGSFLDFFFLARINFSARTGVKVRASTSEVSSATVIVSASERKNAPVTPVSSASGRKTTTGVTVEPMIGIVISETAFWTATLFDSPCKRCE